jgi:hypothetical protein
MACFQRPESIAGSMALDALTYSTSQGNAFGFVLARSTERYFMSAGTGIVTCPVAAHSVPR